MSKRQQPTDAGRPRTGEPSRDATAPAAAPSAVSAVGELMAERRRFEEWLAALEARRDATPSRVFTRVHADYTARLEAVVQELTGHTEGLRAELSHLTRRLAELTEEQQHARDERAEAELRAHVGELTAAEWDETARAADERIEALVARRTEAESDLARTRELLANAERPATPHRSAAAVPAAERRAEAEASVTASVNAATAAATPASGAVVADSAEAALHVPAAASGDDPSAAVHPDLFPAESKLVDGPGGASPRGRTSTFDEMAFLNSVVDAPPDRAAADPADAPPAAPTPPPSPAPVRPISSPPRPGAPPARRGSAPARSGEQGIENLDATADRSILENSGKKGTPMAANVSGNHPIVLREKAVENGRTLKCADCGAMNYPTEWYCERCGAELASL